MAEIAIRTAGGTRERYPLAHSRVNVRRSRDSDIFLPDQWLSRHHAAIEERPDGRLEVGGMIGQTLAHYRLTAAIGAGGVLAQYRVTVALWRRTATDSLDSSAVEAEPVAPRKNHTAAPNRP